MEEIKVGEYVRTKDGVIAKVTYVDAMMVDCDRDVFDLNNLAMMEIPTEYIEEYIVKHSSNIIDLIEEGDYVNGYKVLDVVEDMKTGELHLEMPMDYTNPELGDCTIYNKDIKNVVTKEQFERMKYIVGDESNESNSNIL